MTKKNIFYYLLGTGILFIGVLYNTFPFINGDTTVYITSGIENHVPHERPIFYGYFLLLTSLKTSLWLTALAQCLIMFGLLSRFIKVVIPVITQKQTLLITLVLCLTTGLWFEVGKLMADVFTAYLSLALFLMLFDNSANKGQKLLYLFVIFYSTISHNSHILILSASPFILWLVFRYTGVRAKALQWSLLLIIPLAWLTVCTSNYLSNGNFTVSRASHVFLMGKMVENGMLKKCLDEKCATEDWKICHYADSLPYTGAHFVWDFGGPVWKTGGWDANKQEYNEVLLSIISSPKHLLLLLYKSIIEAGVQMTQCDYGTDLMRCDDKTNIQQAIKKHYEHEYNRSMWSRQTILEIPFDDLNLWYYLFLCLSSVWVAYLYSLGLLTTELRAAYIFLVVLLFLNAYVSANFANIGDRLNTRLFWLIPALHLLSIFHWLTTKKELKF
jgi:hypothetical protein